MNPLRVLHVRGSQAEMGAQLGRACIQVGEHEAAVNHFPNLLDRMLSDANARQPGSRLLHLALKPAVELALRRLEKGRPPEYVARTNAGLKAAGLPKSFGRHVLLMDVFQNIVGIAGRYKVGPFARPIARATIPACSSLVVWDDASVDGQLRHARNFDFPSIGVWDKNPSVVFCDPDDGLRYGYVTTFGVDVPGVTAFNEAGITVSLHTRFHEEVTFAGAAIVDVSHDLVRRAKTLDDAIAICQSRTVASTWGIAISSASERQAVVLETTASGAMVVRPSAGRPYLTCTNRNRHPDKMNGQVSPMPAWAEHSDSREARLHQIALDAMGRRGMSLEDLQCTLGDHTDAETGQERAAGGVISQAMTVKSVVFEPDAQRLHVSASSAPTGWGPYVPVDWDWDAEVGVTEIDVSALAPIAASEHLSQGACYRMDDRGRGYEYWVRASRLDDNDHDAEETRLWVELAATADPNEPVYRFMAGILRLRRGDWSEALEHFEAGLTQENGAFRRGQLLIWGSRAAVQAGRESLANQMRHELLGLRNPHLEDLQRQAQVEAARPYRKKKLRALTYNLSLVDAI